jgi:hypothetical protein
VPLGLGRGGSGEASVQEEIPQDQEAHSCVLGSFYHIPLRRDCRLPGPPQKLGLGSRSLEKAEGRSAEASVTQTVFLLSCSTQDLQSLHITRGGGRKILQ